ncbi:RagB/SusD family nutrient uptake outer membrane protein [Niabella beijingensis]|uniref:RagB/SusD family nutrient uptake outer membrane protein n=1 Tax=Niabella beijingensis TaxID=2872700 RepID=UPI001CBE923B|nr:RagB/SusD family nutrient uptake outer membrane protein [Niabella beijingensis]MBZ4187972.1 RagB/SusD family nutrient uptake outer membrane protein [Niabella beijingensis]
MKQYKVIVLFIFLSGFLVQCKKGFLDRTPQSEIIPEIFFNTEKDLELYTNSFYGNTAVIPNAEGVYNEDDDNVIKNSLNDFLTGKRVVPVSGGSWNWYHLRNINYFLMNYTKAQVPAARHYGGVAHLFRALFYFDKVATFGDVPWYGAVIDIQDSSLLNRPRDRRTLVMDSVLADLDTAISWMNDSKSVEKVTRWAALAYKSRICLFEGTFRKYHPEFNLPDADKFLTAAATAAEELIDSDTYQLYTSTPDKAYQELFSSKAAIDKEVILTRRYSNDLQIWHNVNYYTLTASYGRPGLEKKLVNSYLMKDGSRFTDKAGYNTQPFFNEVQDRDPRLSQTIRTPGYTRTGNTKTLPPDFTGTVTGYQLIKFVTTEAEDFYNRSTNDMPLIRYAEVLLNFAEAKAELGTLTQADIDKSIKLLRDRVGMPDMNMGAANGNPDSYLAGQYTHVSGTNKGVILEIRRERRIELVMESFRRRDLLRWKEGHLFAEQFKGMYFPGVGPYDLDGDGKVDVYIYTGTRPPESGPQYLKLGSEIILENNTNGGPILVNPQVTKVFDETRDYLEPIPVQEIQLNPNLVQNPNWK